MGARYRTSKFCGCQAPVAPVLSRPLRRITRVPKVPYNSYFSWHFTMKSPNFCSSNLNLRKMRVDFAKNRLHLSNPISWKLNVDYKAMSQHSEKPFWQNNDERYLKSHFFTKNREPGFWLELPGFYNYGISRVFPVRVQPGKHPYF